MVATKDSKDKKKGAKGVKDEKNVDETVNSKIILIEKFISSILLNSLNQ